MANALTPDQVIALWLQQGGPRDTAAAALAHAYSESSLNPAATSSNPDGGTNVGLYQLDTPGGVGHGYSVSQLENPALNTQITVRATGGGKNWGSWADNYQDFMSQAQAQVAAYKAPPGTLSQIENLATGGLSGEASGLASVASGLTGLATDFEGVAKALTWLTLPTNWTRVFAGVMGGGFLAVSIYLLGKEAGA